MSFRKTENNIKQFEKNISNAVIALFSVAFLITTILFGIIIYQSDLQKKAKKSKSIDVAITLFQSNLSEKLAIIASSNVFIDFLTSGSVTRKELEPRFLTELLPLKTSGVIGYSLINTETGTEYWSGFHSNQFLTLKLCYLANNLDSKNGNCYGSLILFFSKQKILNDLIRINSAIQPCESCRKYSFSNNSYFGSFLIDNQTEFGAGITIVETQHDNIFYYYLIIVFILFGFALFNKVKLRKMIKETISKPLDALVKNIKNQVPISNNSKALYEINYLYAQIEADRIQIIKINEYEKKAALGYLAAGVAHDIRSPLAVMEITMSKLSESIAISQFAILNQAIQSVRDIANNLLRHHRQLNDKIKLPENSTDESLGTIQEDENIARPVLLSSLIEFVISQKKLEWQNEPCQLLLTIAFDAKDGWIYAAPNDVKRIFSNLLNNAYEALLNKREIAVTLIFVNKILELEIKDTGQGVPESKVEYVLNGMSLKHTGEGLGLSGAKKYIESLGGRLKLSSALKQGTTVTLQFQSISKPI